MNNTSSLSSRAVFNGLLRLIPLCWLLVCGNAWAFPVARLRSVRPVVEVKKGSRSWNVARDQDTLVYGNFVRSGAKGGAQIVFNDGSQVLLRASTQVEIVAAPAVNQPLVLRLFGAIGEIFVHAKSPTQVRTAAAIAASQGTEYLVRLDSENQTTVTVTESNVSFSNPQGAVVIAPNQQSTARVGSAPTPPVAVDASGLVQWTFDVAALPLEIETTTVPTSADLETARQNGATAAELANIEAQIALSQGDNARARNILGNFVGNSPRAGVLLALVELRTGNPVVAQHLLEVALNQSPQEPQARTLLANALLAQNQGAEALVAAQQAIKDEPKSAAARATLALAQFFTADVKNARKNALQAVKLNPFSPLALLSLGRIEQASGNLDEARQALAQAESLQPDMRGVERDLGEIFLALDQLPRAEKAFRAALVQRSDDVAAQAGLATVFLRTGRENEAKETFTQALNQAPQDPFVRARYADFLIVTGDLTGAAKQADEIRDATGPNAGPEYGALLIRLSEAALFRQKLNDAMVYAQKAVSLLPGSAIAHYQLGRVYLEQERNTQAQNQFRLATAIDPDFNNSRYALGVTEELISAGRDTSRASGQYSAAIESSQSRAVGAQNLSSPGANERIQAAIADPTVVRTATRSYGDFQLDGAIGTNSFYDSSLSYLKEDGDKRSVVGASASASDEEGIRKNAGYRAQKAGVLYGKKDSDSPSGIFASVTLEHSERNFDTGVQSSSPANEQKSPVTHQVLQFGFNEQKNASHSTRFLFQADRYLSYSTFTKNRSDDRAEAYHGELRHDWRLTSNHRLIVGASAGENKTRFDSLYDLTPSGFPFFGSQQGDSHVGDLSAYIRDQWNVTSRLRLESELKFVKRTYAVNFAFSSNGGPLQSFPKRDEENTVGLPTVVASYSLSPSTLLRARYRHTYKNVAEFQLLSPSDVFLLDLDSLPGTTDRGKMMELELNHTWHDGSFARLGLYNYHSIQAGSVQTAEILDNVRAKGIQFGYERLIGRKTALFTNVNYDTGHANTLTSISFEPVGSMSLSGQPKVHGDLGLQYLDDQGFFIQPSVAYIGSRFEAKTDAQTPRVRTGGFTLANLRVGKRFGLRSVFYGEVINLFDKSYTVDLPGGLQPRLGRQYRIGASLRF